MGLNISTASAGGSFLDIVRFDARAGRIFRNDRQDGVTESSELKAFKAVMDMENIEVGWLLFAAGMAPVMVLVPLGEPMPPRPNEDAKQGFRMVMKLDTASAGGMNPIREMAGTSKALVGAISALHDHYLAGLAANPGKLPVVALTGTIPVESGSGAKKSTNYSPVFAITGWVSRPATLVASPRDQAPVSAPAAAPAARAPATGSRIAPPPAAAVGADDFG